MSERERKRWRERESTDNYLLMVKAINDQLIFRQSHYCHEKIPYVIFHKIGKGKKRESEGKRKRERKKGRERERMRKKDK